MVYPDKSHDCLIQFRKDSKNTGHIVLGVLFLTNYFQFYDVTLHQMSLLPLSKEKPVLGQDGNALKGFGEIQLSQSINVEFEQNVEYTLNASLLAMTVLSWALFLYLFSRVEWSEPVGALNTET